MRDLKGQRPGLWLHARDRAEVRFGVIPHTRPHTIGRLPAHNENRWPGGASRVGTAERSAQIGDTRVRSPAGHSIKGLPARRLRETSDMGLRSRAAVGDCVTSVPPAAHLVTLFLQGFRFGDGHAQADEDVRSDSGRNATRWEQRPMLRSSLSRSRSSFATSPQQREKVSDQACIVCWKGPCDPAHLIPRSLAPDPGGDPIRVVPLCRRHHSDYDTGSLDLLPHLMTLTWRHELAHAVLDHPGGMVGALERITNSAWHSA